MKAPTLVGAFRFLVIFFAKNELLTIFAHPHPRGKDESANQYGERKQEKHIFHPNRLERYPC
ncbi:hypothetical protein [Corynebacterium sp. sy039]|uniref:hypothetical protein n=1 Tax=Corynebacterium sp. sy039 TaxID=2599641 RepID=UPI0011B64822|nr:hypothetical protein [Corynebacterium sp. sy039]QDZ42198.1 hypothetical protein FQV43_02715 [Corynebacterium sp. sy039]